MRSKVMERVDLAIADKRPQDWAKVTVQEVSHLMTHIAAQEAEIEQLKQDTARLDWMIKYHGRVYQSIHRQFDCEWIDDGMEKETPDWHDTPRDAIDAAIAVEET